jgi:ABC-type nitrate/sulfonate/bicarbonate transport systems, periplasmic components
MEDKTMKILAIGIVGILVAAAAIYMLLPDDEEGEYDITLAFGNSSGWQPLLFAYHTGMFEAEGLNVTLKYAPSSKQSVEALMAGEADMAFSSPDPVFGVLNQPDLDVVLVANSRVPRISGATTLHQPSNALIAAAPYVQQYMNEEKTVEGDSVVGLRNFVDAMVDDSGVARSPNSKIALQVSSTYRSVWLGFVELLYKGGDAFGVSYPGDQITENQYNKMMDVTDSSIYLDCVSYDLAAAAVMSNQAIVAMGTQSSMFSAASNAANPSTWDVASIATLVDSGMSTVLTTQDAFDNKYEAIIKVLRAYDKAGALMRDPSTAGMVAEVCVPLLYDISEPGSFEAAKQNELTYYAGVDWDICHGEGTLDRFYLIASLNPLLDATNFLDIYDVDVVIQVVKDVHMDQRSAAEGGVWYRTF